MAIQTEPKSAQPPRLAEGEYRFASLVWQNEPLGSGQLVLLSEETLGWKKSTTYTVLKKLCERGILQNEGSVITALVKQNEVQQAESAAVVEKTFDGSLPQFVAAFLDGRPISNQEAAEIRALLDAAERGQTP
ncbi:MAG: BlaI/MecI/CopY family transcriptional regulator [Gemmiger sp.]|nr:BlaI/MecI/CopY family transcriptional regulator [Gemmiger sp.]